jgi:hypothetical protein
MGMGEYSGWLLQAEEKVPAIFRMLLYFYRTYMAIPWMVAFSALAIISYHEISNLYMAYIILGFSILAGIAITVLMIMSMSIEVIEVVWLRKLYSEFIYSLENDTGNMWNSRTIEKFEEFQKLFKRICPQEKPLKIPHYPDVEVKA